MDHAIRDTVQVMLVIARVEAQVSITSVDVLCLTHYHEITYSPFKKCLTFSFEL